MASKNATLETDPGYKDHEQNIIQYETETTTTNGTSKNMGVSTKSTEEHLKREDHNMSLDIVHNYSSEQTYDTIPLKCGSLGSEINKLQENLISLGLDQGQINVIIDHGDKLIEKPLLLSKKLNITLEKAKKVLDILKMFKQSTIKKLTPEIIRKIEDCLKENSEFESHEDIAMLCEIEEDLVSEYFRMQPLTEIQKFTIKEKFNAGYSIGDIANILNASDEKVKKFVESTFITFSDDEGKRVLEIIHKNIGKNTPSIIRDKVINNDLKLQDQLCCILPGKNECEYNELKKYFKKFEESKSFFDFDTKLSTEDISIINQNGVNDIVGLSIKLQKVESVIRKYLEQYSPDSKLIEQYQIEQNKQIQNIQKQFGDDKLKFYSYRMVIANSFEEIMKDAELPGKTPKEIFQELLPLTFYYLKCSLPFEDITQILANTCKISLTNHEIFHIIFQLSDPILRGFCIEHYSFSNPVPFYYPVLSQNVTPISFKLSHELWYSMESFNGLISFGLGRAGWNQMGKSDLLDLIFGTDFANSSPQKSAFHSGSIDIQMTKNLFSAKVADKGQSTKWAYLDCQGHTKLEVINVLCQQLDIALVHISYKDYIDGSPQLKLEILESISTVKFVYFLIRDFNEIELKRQEKAIYTRKSAKFIFIPDLTSTSTNIQSVKRILREVGYEILHLKSDQIIRGTFLEGVLGELDKQSLKAIRSDDELIKKIREHIKNETEESDRLNFSSFNYYPLFVEYMKCFYRACYETDQKLIDDLNGKRKLLHEKLLKEHMGKVVEHFNEILESNRSTLIMWKLSQELSLLSKELFPKNVCEQKNDKFTLEIVWRETLLYNKYGNLGYTEADYFKQKIASNYSKHVEMGEAFELIDGDNLRFFDKEIDLLLTDVYKRQKEEILERNEGKEAPIVVSIFGPQSSGKSTLLNYCFGCKFLTSAGRCTRGIYGSLSRLSQPVNGANQFLILDTEGLDSIERKNTQDTSIIHFDRTMVLFCLAVSQVVIINVRGDIGSQMQNMLQICAYALNKLKVRRVAPPKIFIVLNQQADPDPGKHLDSINILMENIQEESYLLDTEGVKMSDLIQITRENLFILPSAFNSDPMNKPNSKLFDSDVIKLSPTVTFAEKCANLRLSIIDQLNNLKSDEREHFQTMSEWIQMSGTIWDTIINYQDIVKYGDIQEIKCSDLLNCIVSEIMQLHIYNHRDIFDQTAKKLTLEIQNMKTKVDSNIILTSIMLQFDETFNKYNELSLTDFFKKCQNDKLLKELSHICGEAESNLAKLLYMVRKEYEDGFKYQIKVILTEIKLSDSMIHFQELIIKNVDKYLEFNVEQQKCAFEKTWAECFRNCDMKEEETECYQRFSDLYSIFTIESKAMEKQSKVYDLFRNMNFQMDGTIGNIYSDLLARFQGDPTKIKGTDKFFFATNGNNRKIKEMTPHLGRMDYEYFSKESFFVNCKLNHKPDKHPEITELAPKECHPLIKYCSGYFNHPDIFWNKLNKESQILLLASQLRDPNNSRESTWEKLLNNISTEIKVFIGKDPSISSATVREMINYLTQLFKIVNYELEFIHAKLSNTAERTIGTFVFALAFKSLWEITSNKLSDDIKKKDMKKETYCQYFLQKIENRKMVRGEWDRGKMRESDQKISQKFAVDFLGGVERGILNVYEPIIEHTYKERKESLSHESIFFEANNIITKELHNAENEVLNTNHIVVQYICNRNELIKKLFEDKWRIVEDELYHILVSQMKADFVKQMGKIIQVLERMINDLIESCSEARSSEQNAFDSDSNFDIICEKTDSKLKMRERESPFKAMVTYLRMYLDPKVTAEEFETFFSKTFELDGVKIKKSDTYILCNKPNPPTCVLSQDLFKKLESTKMFNSENIFSIHDYITGFTKVISDHKYEISLGDFGTMVRDIKENYKKDVLGCPNQCPSCGKFCERKLHPNDGICHIKTGHQICSMGGKVWKDDLHKTAVLFTCDDYKDDTIVTLCGKQLNWGMFKERSKKDWNWVPPEEEKFVTLQRCNQEKMKLIWDKFGQAIIQYYAQKGTQMKYEYYTSVDEIYNSSCSFNYNICFVIDGTGSMHTDIKKARKSVKHFVNKYKQRGCISHFKVVIYRDHCDTSVVEMYPVGNKFTQQHEAIQQFLKEVKASGGGDYPEAALDGLATAATKCEWNTTSGNRNIIIHIFDAPPHGDFPNYNKHHKYSDKKNCCCCNHGTLCPFDWERDVWGKMKEFQIKYYGINTGKKLSKFVNVMKTKLGDLNGNLQEVSKEQVNDAILSIFIDYEMR